MLKTLIHRVLPATGSASRGGGSAAFAVPLAAALLLTLASCDRDRYVAFSGYAQGGVYTVKMNLREVTVGQDAVRAHVDSLLEAVDFSLSGYNKASLLSRLNAGERIRPDSLLVRIYDLSYRYWKETGGAFDVSAGPLFDAWGFGFKKGEMPSDAQVRELLPSCGMARLKPSMEDALSADGTLCATDLLLEAAGALSAGSRDGRPGREERVNAPALNFNAVAQGFTADLVASYLRSIGVKDMLVDIGEIWCCGLNPSRRGWTVGIDSPVDGNNTPGASIEGVWSSEGASAGIVTSGNYRKFYVRDGRKYAHTVDPRTGYPVSHNLLSATMVAPDAATADALATACMVIGPDEAKALILSDPSLEGCLLIDGEPLWTSPGFRLKER